MNLLIVSHTPHFTNGDGVVGWGPTVREIDYLSRVFDRVTHLAPLHEGSAPASSLPYLSPKVRFLAVRPAGGPAFRDKLKILREYAEYIRILKREIPQADVVHVRCPANISLLAIVMLTLAPNPPWRWIKYAGNWRPEGKEAASYTLQRFWLRQGFSRGIVTINGRWPGQPHHVYSFLNPSLSTEELQEARAVGRRKTLSLPLSLLFVGRLEAAKGVGRVLQIAQELQAHDIAFALHLVGDGLERPAFEAEARAGGLGSEVVFPGWLPRPELTQFYGRAHFFLFPSASEGWPKVLSEAMAYGAVPLAGAVSSIPQILAETGAGLALPPSDTQAFVRAIRNYLANPDQWQAASRAGLDAASRFTYEHYLHSLSEVFEHSWGLKIPLPIQEEGFLLPS